MVVTGNPGLWIVAAVALDTRYGWPAALVLLKPTMIPFALVGVRTRAWWVVTVILVTLLVVTLPLSPDYMSTASVISMPADS